MLIVDNFNNHTFWGVGHVAFAMIRPLRQLGAKLIFAIDREKIDGRNCVSYCVSENRVNQWKTEVFRLTCNIIGINTFVQNRSFDSDEYTLPAFTSNQWFIADSWEARLESLRASLINIFRIGEYFKAGEILPDVIRYITIGVDPQEMLILTRISVKLYDFDEFVPFYEEFFKQVTIEGEFLSSMATNSPGGLTCAIHNDPYLTSNIPSELFKTLIKSDNKEGIWVTQTKI